MSSNIDKKAAQLVQGSVWEAPNGSFYTVLGVTNISVHSDENSSETKRERYPLSVVFMNADNEVFSTGIRRFLRCDYNSMNEDVAEAIEHMYRVAAGLESVEDPEDIDDPEDYDGSVEPKEESKAEEEEPIVLPENERTLAQQLIAPHYTVKFVPVNEDEVTVSSESLASSFYGISTYLDSTGTRFHKIIFLPNDTVNLHTLNSTFNPEFYEDENTTYDRIILNDETLGEYDVEWNTFCGITPEIIDQKVYVAMTLAFLTEEASSEDEEVAYPEVQLESETEEITTEPSEDTEEVVDVVIPEPVEVPIEHKHPGIVTFAATPSEDSFREEDSNQQVSDDGSSELTVDVEELSDKEEMRMDTEMREHIRSIVEESAQNDVTVVELDDKDDEKAEEELSVTVIPDPSGHIDVPSNPELSPVGHATMSEQLAAIVANKVRSE